MTRLVICEDEPLATERLVGMLARCPGVEIVGIATDGHSALAEIAGKRPDAVLLDIEMPGLDGFDVIEELGRRDRDDLGDVPLIIFVTAFPRFAAQAFETGALDFLTKPVRRTRLEKALERLNEALLNRDARARLAALVGQLDTMRAEHHPSHQPDSAIWVQRWNETVRIDAMDVDWVKAEGEYVRLHCADSSYLHRETISALAARFEDFGFIRIHRSHIIQQKKVKAIRRSRVAGMSLVLEDGVRLPVGRTYRASVQRIIDPSS
jgi:DNA-binding LytR/AlgR family response regulator